MRKCNVCEKVISVGYADESKEVEYCSDVCLYTVYTKQEHNDLYNNEVLYWTDWFDEEEEENDLTLVGGN